MKDTDLPPVPPVEASQGAGAPSEPGPAPDPAQSQGSGASAAEELSEDDPNYGKGANLPAARDALTDDEKAALAQEKAALDAQAVKRAGTPRTVVFIAPEDAEMPNGDGVRMINKGDYVFTFEDGDHRVVPASAFRDLVGRD